MSSEFEGPYGNLPVWDFPVLAKFREATLATDKVTVNTGWEDTLVPFGFALAGSAFNDEAMLNWARDWAAYHLDAPKFETDAAKWEIQRSGEAYRGLAVSQYCGEWGSPMVFATLHKTRPDDRLLEGMIFMCDHLIENSLRWNDGIIGHGPAVPYPWVDTLYYSASVLSFVTSVTGETRYAEEAVKQCMLHAKHLRDERTGLFFHEVHADGRRADWFWARGNGWIIMALADTLKFCPPQTPGYGEVMALYRSIVTGLLRLQHPSGLWRIIPENEESHLETSGSVMIAVGLTIGIDQGWIDANVSKYVLRTWWELLTWITQNGVFMGCQTPAGAGGWEQHKLSVMGSRTYGTGTLLRLVAEMRTAGLI